MDQLLKNAFKQQIQAKEGFEFEDFIDELFLLKYGVDNYIPIRRNKDKGNDGTILAEQKILACYAPRKYNKTDFEIKVLGSTKKDGDFEKYQENWKIQYPNWEMYVNHEISPEQFTLIQGLDGNTSIKGIDQILLIIDELTSSKKRKLASFLGIENFFIQDYIQDIINDLLNASDAEDKVLHFDKKNLIPPQKKIELNFEKEDWDGMHSEMMLVMEEFMTITNILAGYNDDEINTLKRRIIGDYNKLSGNFKERLYNLTEQYTREYGNMKDDEYIKCVKSILLYMFEQCLIGKKTDNEL
ncbi:hypothetical protein KRE47_07875 [Elizabethkingia meningoseptica]|uniref:hypothetical protein n=1 Tax=Elizabethkingia meningoseptica TaxID=238 RepID=UPI0023B1952C|nr:hypothetical protein [Elizabethkingia meningoseptica]MDE5467951.1 hypothetical protein [Elizabethkingia meningoseptica]MDE5474870.1 hypothetical protein [Elizabethkingia meningoseptica]MDE5478303.1 hypothetical protein [Elizabethkingia meningoseptica]MDE5486702.1 hypothetical protein [Elizabethkingia meningoseptica]MDE5501706.1 hypothetical protein [Elizabethkingia meningoseptica]